METAPEIVYEGMEPSMTAQTRIEAEIAKLERYFGHITSCRVVLRAPKHHRQHGDLFEVRIHMALPDGREVAATRNPLANHAHEDALVAIRDAFRAARRQLLDEVRQLQGKVKHHEPPTVGIIHELNVEGGFGFIETLDGREIYFHRNSVLGDAFGDLEVGSGVSYAEEQGEKGPQASTVRLMGKHGVLIEGLKKE